LSCWEEHAVDLRLLSTRDGGNHELLATECFLHDKSALVKVAKEYISAGGFPPAARLSPYLLNEPGTTAAREVAAEYKVAKDSTKCVSRTA